LLVQFCGIACAVISASTYPAWRRFVAPGSKLVRQDQPRLFERIDRIASLFGQQPPSEIYLTDDVDVGVCQEGGLLRDGKLPRASRALLADAFGTLFGALTGTSTVTSYIESAAGVAAGARTGLGNVVIAALFLVAMFCAPLVAAIPAYATAPALILVGALMCSAVARVNWHDFSEAFPAFLTLVATPLTFSIATGLSLGLLSFTFVKLGTGRHREISPLIWVLSVLFLLRYAFLGAE